MRIENTIIFILVGIGIAGFCLAILGPDGTTKTWGGGLVGTTVGVFANKLKDGKLEAD